MKTKILLIGEDLNLQRTRAMLLSEWATTIVHLQDVEQAFSTQRYQLIILCQSVAESTAREIIAQAKVRQPEAKMVAVSRVGEDRQLGVPGYHVDFNHPHGFVDAVAELLAPA